MISLSLKLVKYTAIAYASLLIGYLIILNVFFWFGVELV